MDRILKSFFVAFGLGIFGFAPAVATDIPSEVKEQYRRPLQIPFPERAPYSPLVATLGKMLYFDPRVSGAQNMSCASCHNPSFGWEAPVARAVGAMNTMVTRWTLKARCRMASPLMGRRK